MATDPSAGVTLAIDTGSPVASVVLGRRQRVLCSKSLDQRSTSRSLFEILQECMDEAGCKRVDLVELRVVRGPGSFTGLRVGLAFALGLHQSLGVPVLGAETSSLLAWSLVEMGSLEPATSAVHALNDDWFVQEWRRLPELLPEEETSRRSLTGSSHTTTQVVVTNSPDRLRRAELPVGRIVSAPPLAEPLLTLPIGHLESLVGGSWQPLYLSGPPVSRTLLES